MAAPAGPQTIVSSDSSHWNGNTYNIIDGYSESMAWPYSYHTSKESDAIDPHPITGSLPKAAAITNPSSPTSPDSSSFETQHQSTIDDQHFGDSSPTFPSRRRGRPRLNATSTEDYHASIPSTRDIRMEKNRIAAQRCRNKKRVWVERLEERNREYSRSNKLLRLRVADLRDEVLTLKTELLKHAGCGYGNGDVGRYLVERCSEFLFQDSRASESSGAVGPVGDSGMDGRKDSIVGN